MCARITGPYAIDKWNARKALPLTTAQIMADPRVTALVEASTQFAKAAMSRSDLGWPLFHLDEALAPFTEAKP
jgi:hypothetical protein